MFHRLTVIQKSVYFRGPHVWTSLPLHIRESRSLDTFKKLTKQHMIDQYTSYFLLICLFILSNVIFTLLIKCLNIVFTIVVFCPSAGGSGWIIGVGWLGSSSTASGTSDTVRKLGPNYSLGRRDLFFASCRILLLLNSLLSPSSSVSLTYFILTVLVRECLQEFHISYCHAEWYLPLSGCATTSSQCVFGANHLKYSFAGWPKYLHTKPTKLNYKYYLLLPFRKGAVDESLVCVWDR